MAGIAIVASEATVEQTAVKNTQGAASGLFGDGIAVLSRCDVEDACIVQTPGLAPPTL